MDKQASIYVAGHRGLITPVAIKIEQRFKESLRLISNLSDGSSIYYSTQET